LVRSHHQMMLSKMVVVKLVTMDMCQGVSPHSNKPVESNSLLKGF